ncbi:hypothetical protein F0A17_02470 [Billgrantia pellis]|uniref:Uncharacterized protein n=1 Tax=Billgrantia pellis TaxID=2606936 RepID=A0A7V7G442_9GAMM|nr:hypothetical protein [Halomonas pellis]KAA0014531.1 hypothetical protein F0A17_02470 [Halomonas pellis]
MSGDTARARLVALVALAALLFSPPLVVIFDRGPDRAISWLPFYLFVAWLLTIVLTAWLVERGQGDE